MNILNLYAGIGGNRRSWGNEHEVVAVENNSEIAAVYKDLFPRDVVAIEDVHTFLDVHSKNLDQYDFIWASPPCPTHSQYRYNVGVRAKGYKPVIPDMTSLYGLIVFLKHHFQGGWCVENVRPYYEPLIPISAKVGRHVVWTSFPVEDLKLNSNGLRTNNKITQAEEANGFDLSKYKIKNKRQILRNCTDGEVGGHVLDSYQRRGNGGGRRQRCLK